MKFIITTILVMLSQIAFAQQKLTESELSTLQNRAKGYIVEFEGFISDIANRNTKDSEKDILISAASKLFESNAIIEISNVNGAISKRAIPTYLQNLRRLSQKYGVIVISFTNMYFDVNDLEEKKDKYGNTIYKGYASFKQCFCADLKRSNSVDYNSIDSRKYTTDCSAYGDCTHKKIEVVIQKVVTIKGERWVVKLGDISVVETNAVK